ncbi:MAG: FKBP-type peptidyl-prolyl cis-trans isomerase [Eggerthellaceae bacterium]|nr:FKBP-type peptidyl-prolyl cis-trans isomerase [Eggerthellaceae bacterium]
MKPKSGDTVYVLHRVCTDDGEELESSYGKKQPFRFTVDSNRVIAAMNSAVKTLEKGEKATVKVPPEEAHGNYDTIKRRRVRKTTFYNGIEVGQTITFQGDLGEPVPAKVISEEEDFYILDMNHPLAGKGLVVDVELVDFTEESDGVPFI